jgi:hypothetical protein
MVVDGVLTGCRRKNPLRKKNELVPNEKIRNWNVGKASYFVRRKRHTFAVILRRFTFFLGRITYVTLRLVPTVIVRITKNIERIDAVFARGGVKSAKRNVFQSLAGIIPIPATLIYIDNV